MRRISLDGLWSFVADLDPKYHLDTRIYPLPAYAEPAADRRHWQKVRVPGVWQTYGPRYEIFEGVGWFAREFDAGAVPAQTPARLRFGGVNYRCRVFLNGREVGAHEGGYTEFTLDATGHLHNGFNHIAVMVDNRATGIKWPPCLGYFNYGGMHRDVALELFDRPALDEIALTAGFGGDGGTLRITGRVAKAEDGMTVQVTCAGRDKEGSVARGGGFDCFMGIPGAEPWSPEHPRLYEVGIALRRKGTVLDRAEIPCGFRTLAVQKGRIHLNGTETPLRGICYVYDSPVHGLVMTADQLDLDLRLLRQLGVNAVRCHYPMDRRFYEACDRAGILVWIEPNIYCLHPADGERNTPFADPDWQAVSNQMVGEMIRGARNHPSVILYGIGNECNASHPEAEPFFRRLAARIRKEDPARLLSYAALYGNVGPLADMVDVLGINSYWGWYDRIFTAKAAPADAAPAGTGVPREPIDLTPMRQMLDKVQAEHANIALLLTEFGADSVPGFLSRSRDLWSEDYHADLLQEILALAKGYPRIAGTFPFCFSDYRDPSKVHNGYWNEVNLKGVVTREREKKLAFKTLQRAYRHSRDGNETATGRRGETEKG